MAGILNAIEVSSRGLSVQRHKMNVVAENMANAETVETPEGGPYRRKRVLVTQDSEPATFNNLLTKAKSRLTTTNPAHRGSAMVRTGEVIDVPTSTSREVEDPASSFRLVYDPTHPMANEDGYVKMPDIEVINEMVDMMAASRGYEANTAVISASKKMARDALDI